MSSPVPIVKDTILGVYIPSGKTLPVIGNATNNGANIGACYANVSQETKMIDCVSGLNQPTTVLHVEAIIGM